MFPFSKSETGRLLDMGRMAGTEGDGDVRDVPPRWTRVFPLNGGPQFTFSAGHSFFVNCETQKKWTSCGRSFLKAEKSRDAAG